MGIGIAMTGERCVAEIQFCDYIFNTIDLLKIAGNTHWVSHGNYSVPLVVMTPVGAGIRGSIYHSHSFDSWASRLPGWKVVMPSTPIDAYGLLLSAIVDPNPVLFLKPKALMRVRGEELIPGEPLDEKELKARIDAPIGDRSQWQADWPELQEHFIPIGKAKLCLQGQDLTLVSWGRHLLVCLQVAKELKESRNISVEVIDLRSIYPYDWQAIKSSIEKTGRVLFVNEDTEVTTLQNIWFIERLKSCFIIYWQGRAFWRDGICPGSVYIQISKMRAFLKKMKLKISFWKFLLSRHE
jgi:2-oxoisovalerate dehydrogenase E1 component beta subunit